MYVINSLVLMSATPYTTHLRSLLHVMYVISSLVVVSATPYATHLRSLLPVMYVISSLPCVIHTLSYSSQIIITCYVCDQ